MNTERSQDRYLRTGQANQYRVRGCEGQWYVESTDNNNVWVAAEPGTRDYFLKQHAAESAQKMADNNGGTMVD